MVIADPDRLMQVVANLLSNAAKFTRPGTMVDVRAGKKGDRVRISVRDHGQGIPDEYKGILFDKFFQADPSNSRERTGTGLGLSIARHFTRLMNGEIDFASQSGKGATFFVDLPIAAGASDSAAYMLPRANGARTIQRSAMTED
jgi:signal transduction histidine kinase